jgi:hypothetical protein
MRLCTILKAVKGELFEERHLYHLKSQSQHKKTIATLEDLPIPQGTPTSFAIAE